VQGEKVARGDRADDLRAARGRRGRGVRRGGPGGWLAVKALVVLREGTTLSETAVRRQCQAKLEAFMVPKFIEFGGPFPKPIRAS